MSAEPAVEEIVYENLDEKEINPNNNKLECRAMVFHKEDEIHFRNYVIRITGGNVVFNHEPFTKRMRDVFNVTKFTPIIIFVILFIHEIIVITFHIETNPWILALIFSAVGAIGAFTVDFIGILKEHF